MASSTVKEIDPRHGGSAGYDGLVEVEVFSERRLVAPPQGGDPRSLRGSPANGLLG